MSLCGPCRGKELHLRSNKEIPSSVFFLYNFIENETYLPSRRPRPKTESRPPIFIAKTNCE